MEPWATQRDARFAHLPYAAVNGQKRTPKDFCFLRGIMETPNQRKSRLWQDFQQQSGLARPSRGFKLTVGVIAVILGGIVLSGLFR